MQKWTVVDSNCGQKSRALQIEFHFDRALQGGKELTSFESSVTNIQKALAGVEGSIRAGNPTPYFGEGGSETP